MKSFIVSSLGIVAIATSLLVAQTAVVSPAVAANPSIQAPAVVPKLDALDQQALALYAESQKAAQATCDALESSRRFGKLHDLIDAQLRAKHAGYEMNWRTGQLQAVKPK